MTVEPSVLIDSLSASEGGVARIRQVLLEFAVRGALSEKDSGDPPARELLQYATKDRTAQAVAAPGRSKRRTLPRRSLEAPFALPVTWEWIAIGDAMNLVNGRAFKPSHWGSTGLPIVRIQNLNNSSAPFNNCSFEVAPKFHLKPGDFLISWSGTPGTSFGPFIWEGPPGILNQHIFRAELFGGIYNPKFLRVAINARLDEMIARAHGGVGLQHITKGELESMLIPLPPLAEQKRIVAKVDHLMALCDDLEAKQTKKRDLATQSTYSAVTALASAERGAELSLAWRRVASSFQTLVSTPDDVRNLRGAVAELATKGLLTAQSEKERPAAELTAKLDAASVGDTSTLPLLPSNWLWARLAGLLAFGPENGYSPKAVEYPTDVKALTLSATTSGRFAPQYFKYIDEEIPKDSDLWLRDGDVLIQRGNTLDYVGIAAVYRGRDAEFIYPDLMIKIRAADFVDVDFLHIALNARPIRDYFKAHASGTSGTMPKINQSVLLETPIPVPPLAEQKRIVAKVDHLMSLLDDLEAKLHKQEQTATRLAESLAAAVAA